ncbi:phosphatidylinositol 4-kinase alpha 1-like [Vitis riparia]|uniref:phosphatidylinositol 4-kinase alpha 1-like n=1 Tax=Vitis riparia TaxID=96939 RepID=UPI00155AFA5F|nr:phosphatidylinositol 4-kinase alpha 1-like [Vitis riparia]
MLTSRLPTVPFLKAEVTQLVQLHIIDLRCMPEALPYFVTPKEVDENSTLLQQLPHWPVQALRYDEGRLVEGYLLRAAQRSDIFAHILIWPLQDEQYGPELGKDAASEKNSSFQALFRIYFWYTSATAFGAMSVFQTFLEAAEGMLKENVVGNRAVGSYGVNILQSHIKDSKSLSILTYCNAGSLATTGYGTALGIICFFYAERIL